MSSVAQQETEVIEIIPEHDLPEGPVHETHGTTFSASKEGPSSSKKEHHSVYELVSKAVDETPEQKFQRLEHEVKMFIEELDAIKRSTGNSLDDHASSVTLAREMKVLQTHLQQVKLEQLLGVGETSSRYLDPQGDMTKRLMADVAKFKNTPVSSEQGAITYELYYNPEGAAQTSKGAKIPDLEKRLEQLERIIGTTPFDLIAASTELEATEVTLHAIVQALSAKAASVSKEGLSELDRRLQAVLSQLELAKKKQGADGSEVSNKINELYETTQRWDAIATLVPVLITRLKALKGLHEYGAEFGRTIVHLEDTQEAISSTLASQKDTITKLEGSFAQKFEGVMRTYGTVEKKMDDLSAKIAKLR